MTLPRKNNINVYRQVGTEPSSKELVDRRQELLDRITKADTYLPEDILHDDLDLGMLEFVKENLKVISDGEQIPIIPKILTIQRWSEIANNWTFSDEDGNMRVPFIGVIRKPDVQPGTNPIVQRTIPDRREFLYAAVKTWDGNQMGADIYKMPQPVPIDISYEVIIVCQKFRDLNRFNKIVLQKFSARQAYTKVKGHYIPIILDRISDNSPIDALENRRFYLQSYEFTMMGFLIDSEEFEIKPAINRAILLYEFLDTKNYTKKYTTRTIDITTASFVADGIQTTFSVGENIGFLFFVAVNGLVHQKDIDYYWINGTPRITFAEPPLAGSNITILYYAGKSSVFQDTYGRILSYTTQYFTYDGSSLTFTVDHQIVDIIYVETNGLVEEEYDSFTFSGNEITYLYEPVIGSRIGVGYLR
jgi:hypothetical protein